ncbi:4651_t:CDS:2, partial [Gigaspora rosea]
CYALKSSLKSLTSQNFTDPSWGEKYDSNICNQEFVNEVRVRFKVGVKVKVRIY